MPPKKKTVSPVVVGTVSTRSTRRQSIVNIVIPKSSKPPSKTAQKQLGETKQMTSKKFSDQIRESFIKVVKSAKPATKPKIQSAAKNKGKVKSNKALLEILEDWADDDSQDKKEEPDASTSFTVCDEDSTEIRLNLEDSDSSPSVDENQTFDEVSIQAVEKNIDEKQAEKPVTAVEILVADEEIKVDNNMDKDRQLLIDILENSNGKMDEEDNDNQETAIKIDELSEKTQNESVLDKKEELVVEESAKEEIVTIPMEETITFDDNEIVVECVTEEVIMEDNDNDIVLLEVTGIHSASEDSQEADMDIKEAVVQDVVQVNKDMVVANKESLTSENKILLEEINIQPVRSVRNTNVQDETSRSISTTDSNDAEVRSFFSVEIENNETVNEENIPHFEEASSKENTRDSAAAAAAFELSVKEEIDSKSKVEETSVQVDKEDDDTAKKSDENNKEKDKKIKDEVEERLEYYLEKMEIAREQEEDSLESKVADLHLGSQETFSSLNKETQIKEEKSDFDKIETDKSLTKTDQSLSDTDNKMQVDLPADEKSKESIEKLEKSQKILLDFEQKLLEPDILETRKTRSSKDQKEDKEAKSPKTTKNKLSKDKKPLKQKTTKPPKEIKVKKKDISQSVVKKSKEKSDKKEWKEKKETKVSKTDYDSEDTEVRRSSRIKSISVMKKKTTGHGLVRSKSETGFVEADLAEINAAISAEKHSSTSSHKISSKDRKTKSKSTENLSSVSQQMETEVKREHTPIEDTKTAADKHKLPACDPLVEQRLKQFVHLKENLYKTDRMSCKEAKKMTCDCFLTTDEIVSKEFGCGDDCLNRLLLIECGNLCPVGERCTNKRFQKGQFAPVEVFNADKKGLGLRAAANIPFGEFILEYVGEVLNPDEFDKRAEHYSQDKNIHYYFMSLRADAIIDATMKGNISRFINHSCDPNAETQKWTVNGELRIGFFSTRTILAGEEVTFDYRFQRYGKEAQKCYCEAPNCRGWLGDQPNEDSEEDEDEEDDEEEEDAEESTTADKAQLKKQDKSTDKLAKSLDTAKDENDVKVVEKEMLKTTLTPSPAKRKRSPKKKPRKDMFEDLDQLDEEIEMLITTGLKNQAHTLKLSRLMVRAKEPAQRTKLLRILRRGELPCRRLFLDYHGLRLMHGYMIDAQHLVHTNKRYESLRLEMLQTLAILPILNKTLLLDSKVLPTVEAWSSAKELNSPLDSDSNSPKTEQDSSETKPSVTLPDRKPTDSKKEEPQSGGRSIADQEEEIRFLATKLLEEWANLKEVFRIPKKERIEQMKEHEREANKKFMASGYGEQDAAKRSDRYRNLSTRIKTERDSSKKGYKTGEKPSAEFIRLSKIERRKLFALQHELKEEERRLKQREMWQQHELNCMLLGTDPRFTAPFDPNRNFQCIWNPQIGQWQNYPLALPQQQLVYQSQPSAPNVNVNVNLIPNVNIPPPHLQVPKNIPNYPYAQVGMPPSGMVLPGAIRTQQQQVAGMQGVGLPQNLQTHPQVPTSIQSQSTSIHYPLPDNIKKEEDPSLVKFMGPIPPPAKLPPKWKCAKDKYGRPYYYNIKVRKSQWEPPPFVEPDESSQSESSSDTSSLSCDSSSENSDSEDDIDDARLLIEVRKQMEHSAKLTIKGLVPDRVKGAETNVDSPTETQKISPEQIEMEAKISKLVAGEVEKESERSSIDIRLKEQFNLLKEDSIKEERPPAKKRRVGLCEEIIISPLTEEDRLQFKEDLKRYKANKEKLRRRHKEMALHQSRRQPPVVVTADVIKKSPKEKRPKTSLKARIKEMPDFNSEAAKKIKENFRSNMASTVVGSLNAYRKPDCKEGRITNTEDFKHLARKLTHFVMLKEMKHIARIDDLTCTDNVKMKAREYIRKYMNKFGEVYIKRNDSPDFKD